MTRKIAWYVPSRDFTLASVRYRAIYPALVLQDIGWVCDIFGRPDVSRLHQRIKDYDALVIVKILDVSALLLAVEAHDAEVPIILDLCDDILSRDYRPSNRDLHRTVYRTIAPFLSAVVTTGPALSRQLKRHGVDAVLLKEIPDCAETESSVTAARAFVGPKAPDSHSVAISLKDAVRRAKKRAGKGVRTWTKRIRNAMVDPLRPVRTLREMWHARRRKISIGDKGSAIVEGLGAASAVEGKTVIWFGNHGGPHSDFGILTLLRVGKDLRAAYERAPFTLIVVSNHPEKFRRFLPALGIPVIFVPWAHDAQTQLLARANVFVMPVGEDEFSATKSANRAVLALQAGIPVVAQPLESLEPLRDCISLGNVEEGLVRYLTDPLAVQADIQRSQEIIARNFSLSAIGACWVDLIEGAIRKPVHVKAPSVTGRRSLLAVMALQQDIDIVLPVVDEARARGVPVAVIVGDHASMDPRLAPALMERAIAPTLIRRDEAKDVDYRWLRGADVMFCAAETSAPAHRISNFLTRMANASGMETYTIQHGLECLGLTYKDEEHPHAAPDSKHIITWNHAGLLPAWVEEGVRRRCIGLGRVQARTCFDLPGRPPIPDDGPVIGVFENLHWRRYPDAFRRSLLPALNQAAFARPEIVFLFRPHPAGMWGVTRKPPSLPWAPNIIVASPGEMAWAPWQAGVLAPHLDAVITTPSTVVLDVAEARKPVAIFRDNTFPAPLYDSLPSVYDAETIVRFVDSALAEPGPFQTSAAEFAASVRIEGCPAPAIVDLMFPQTAMHRIA